MKLIAAAYVQLIFLVSYVSADSSFLPNISGGSDTGRRRLKLSEMDDDCLLVKKTIDYEDAKLDKDNWACEFSYEYATKALDGQLFMDIEMTRTMPDGSQKVLGSAKATEMIEKMKPVSGEYILLN